MPKITVTDHYFVTGDHFHANGEMWSGRKMVLLITYEGHPLELEVRKDEVGEWRATNVYHQYAATACPFCQKRKHGGCTEALSYMEQVAQDALNLPSFRLIALLEV